MECEEGHAKYLNSFGTSSSHYNKDFRYSAINTAKHTQALTHLSPMHPFSTLENIRKPYGFWCFQGLQKECVGNKLVKGKGDIDKK